jgi:hypothetical protein
MPNLTTSSTPLSSAPASPAPLFRGAQSYDIFRFVKPLSRPYPERDDKITDLLALTSPYSQRPVSPQGNAKVRNFSLCQAPLPILHPLLNREGKGTKFLRSTSATSPCDRLLICQRSCQTAQPTLPRSHPPFCFTRSPFSGSAKLRHFWLCQAPLTALP